MSDMHKEAAKARGEKRSAEIAQRVQEAMRTIEAEMKANKGIYPHNGGAISKNEVARRAEINPTTFFSPKQRALGESVSLWLDTLKKKEAVGRMRVRRTFVQRAEDWKTRYLALQDSHVKTELDLLQAEAERDEARAEAEKLRQDNAVLLEQLRLSGASKITPIPRKPK
ncbi:MAG: hypothetical protein WBK19_20500 [Azonexus sp.]